jgi:hypothetical protein
MSIAFAARRTSSVEEGFYWGRAPSPMKMLLWVDIDFPL